MKKICPACRREYTELENFCRKCGIALVKESNRCSEMKTALCKTAEFEANDLYCSFCGALTEHGKDLTIQAMGWWYLGQRRL